MKVFISIEGEDSAEIIKEVTEKEYNFLTDIASKLNSNRMPYAPSMHVGVRSFYDSLGED
jgi:hypothetical protein